MDSIARAHHRHPHKDEHSKQDEQSPLVLLRHFSMVEGEHEGSNTSVHHRIVKLIDWKHLGYIVFLMLAVFSLGMVFRDAYGDHTLRVEHAREHYVTVDDHNGIQIWFRTWGNRRNGVPILFVHGGPGNAIADYNNGNREFFDFRKYFVVEVDQRYVPPKSGCVRHMHA
jgi:hypothetical protein